MRTTCALLLVFLLALPASAAEPELSGHAIALDADTLRIGTTRIRLYGVSAVEMKAAGHFARAAVDDVIATKSVTCRQVDTDRYKRPVAICAVDDGPQDLSAWLLQKGHAVTYRAYMDQPDVDPGYLAAEELARTKGLGVWSTDVVQPPEIFGGVFGIYHRELVTGIIAILAAAAGAYAGIFEIRRIRKELKNERMRVAARIFRSELDGRYFWLKGTLKHSRRPYVDDDTPPHEKYKNNLCDKLARMPKLRTALDQDIFRLGDLDDPIPHFILDIHADIDILKTKGTELAGGQPSPKSMSELVEKAEFALEDLQRLHRLLTSIIQGDIKQFSTYTKR